jgi:hypothetical protein
MSSPGDDDLLIRARAALLDAVEALKRHRKAVVVVGAQAIFLRTGSAKTALGEFTKDSDLAIDPRALGNDPRLEAAMTGAGFHLDTRTPQPGSWLSSDEIPVDLLVPEALAGVGGRRGARIPPHSRRATRRTLGLEAALVDRAPMRIPSLDPSDDRAATVDVAGPAALLVAKLHKLGERSQQRDRLVDKDAHDIYRLFIGTETATLAARFRELVQDDLAGAVTAAAVDYLRQLFSGPTALGSIMAGRAEGQIGDAAITDRKTGCSVMVRRGRRFESDRGLSRIAFRYRVSGAAVIEAGRCDRRYGSFLDAFAELTARLGARRGSAGRTRLGRRPAFDPTLRHARRVVHADGEVSSRYIDRGPSF